jgi:hypothetical protein
MEEEGMIRLSSAINEEIQMSNIKGQLFRSMGTRIHVIKTGKPQCLMSNFRFCHLGFGIGLSFVPKNTKSLICKFFEYPRKSGSNFISGIFGRSWNLSLDL